MYQNELYHHGVKGQRWGVRRYQNSDGSLTTEGKHRLSDNTKKTLKKVAVGAAGAGVLAAGSVLYGKNSAIVNQTIKKVASKSLSSIKQHGKETIKKGKEFTKQTVKNSVKGFADGVKEGSYKAPKKAAEAVITGMTFMAAKRYLDKAVGKEEAAKIFQANNNKKISSFWKVFGEDKDDEDDD